MKNKYWFCGIAVLVLLLIFTQSIFSQIEFSSIHGKHIKFISEPSPYGRVGVAYNYTAVAVTADTTAVIRYSASDVIPDGFTIDSISGIVSWTPAKKGWYPIKIIAASSKSNIAVQSFIVAVVGGNGVVQGHVTDTLGNAINHVIIEVLQALNTETTSIQIKMDIIVFRILIPVRISYGQYHRYPGMQASGMTVSIILMMRIKSLFLILLLLLLP